MPAPDLVITSERVVLPDGTRPAAVVVRDGRIEAVTEPDEAPLCANTIDAGAAAVLPGLVDTHVHVNEPGRTEWEGFATATRGAAAGGVTTIVDMPLNCSPVTTTVAALEAKIRAADEQCAVDYGFWGGVVPGNKDNLAPLHDAGVLGFKCFLPPSGIDEFPPVSDADLRAAMPVLTRLGAVLLVHAEDPGVLNVARHGSRLDEDPRVYRAYLASRPAVAETRAVERIVALAREFRTRVHIVHLADADALPAINRAREAGALVTVETCPHYLTFAAEEIPDGGTEFKCAPPIRETTHRERLWTALAAGVIDLIASDHSPCPPELKHLDDGDFSAAWGGIASIQLGLPLVWSGARLRGHPLERVVTWMASAPARLAGIDDRKGRIAVGADADMVVFDPYERLVVDPDLLEHRHSTTPYTGLAMYGCVRQTWLRGEIVFDHGEFPGTPKGRPVRRCTTSSN